MNMSDDNIESEALFPLIGKLERQLIARIVKSVRKCLCREDITAEQIHRMAHLLFGLERLPLATAGLIADLTLSYRRDDGSSFQAIHLDDSSFSLSAGGSVYDPNVGSDSFGDDVLMVETGGYREVKRSQLADWLAEFASRVETAEIDMGLDNGDIEWDDEPDESAWERAAKRHAESDEPEDD
jgi:hypothetical protein